MKIKTLTAISAIALMTVAPAYADTIQVDASADVTAESRVLANNQADTGTVTEQEMERGWEKTKDTVKGAADTAADKAEGAFETVRAAVLDGEAGSEPTYMTVESSMTVKGMLDQAVYNTEGETIGNIDDIILSENGEVKSVVIAHGGFLGLGEERAAFDYNLVMSQQAEGDVVIPVSPEAVEQATPFAYNQEDASADQNVQVMAATDIRASQMIDADITNPQGETVAQVDNITLKNGEAERLIVKVDDAKDASAERAAFEFADITKSSTEDGVQLQLTDAQAQQLAAFAKQEVSSN